MATILLLGASGYLGQAFAREMNRRGDCFIPVTRQAVNYTDFNLLFNLVRKERPEFIINAAGYRGSPNVDACEQTREETLFANTLLPQTIARICSMTNTPWGHISSASIYSGAKVFEGGTWRIERDLNRPELRRLLAEHPELFQGFTEQDDPNFSFRCLPCNFYSGTKALAEEVIRGIGRSYIWRPGMPFNEQGGSKNFLSRIQQYPKIYDSVISLSQVLDFVRACLDLWARQAPFGIYNIVNPGVITSRQVVQMIQRMLKQERHFEFWKNDEEFYRFGVRMPRANCILDIAKLLTAGVEMRPVAEALEDSMRHWHPTASAADLLHLDR
jgi:dTDP-4-dehydrorhamnose reductase